MKAESDGGQRRLKILGCPGFHGGIFGKKSRAKGPASFNREDAVS
jgi:hypothetical protein